jgi:hypothetical protein
MACGQAELQVAQMLTSGRTSKFCLQKNWKGRLITEPIELPAAIVMPSLVNASVVRGDSAVTLFKTLNYSECLQFNNRTFFP